MFNLLLIKNVSDLCTVEYFVISKINNLILFDLVLATSVSAGNSDHNLRNSYLSSQSHWQTIGFTQCYLPQLCNDR